MAVSAIPITRIAADAWRIPTEMPESDGTLEWDATTLVTVHIEGGGKTGFGYSYADLATAHLIRDRLAPLLQDRDAMQSAARWLDMLRAIRNLGRPGIASMAIAAMDVALWDLRAKHLDISLAALLGPARDAIAIYGSGGFTSYNAQQLESQMRGWMDAGIGMVKMKVGRDPGHDLQRAQAVREVIGDGVGLFVDANGAYSRKQALAMAQAYGQMGVSWFEEPVSSDDLEGLRLLRDRAPAGMAISAGEYGYDPVYFRRMLDAGAVDVLQADATRCAGITGWLAAAALCESFNLALSSHCAPSLHLPLCCAARPAIHLEYFHDHVRIEHLLFDGAPSPLRGLMAPDLSRPGLGVEFKEKDAQCYRI